MANPQPPGATLPPQARLELRDKSPLKRGSKAGSLLPRPKRRCDTFPSPTDSSGSSPIQEANRDARDFPPSQDGLVSASESARDIQKAADDFPELSLAGSLLGETMASLQRGSAHQNFRTPQKAIPTRGRQPGSSPVPKACRTQSPHLSSPQSPLASQVSRTPDHGVSTNAKPIPGANSTEAGLSTRNAGCVSIRDTELDVEGTLYNVGIRIGKGSFGVVFKGTRCSDKMDVAFKFERRKSNAPQLKHEYRMYRDLSGSPGIPAVHGFGSTFCNHVLVMPLLGLSLYQLFENQHRRFTFKTLSMLGVSMTSIIEGMHEKQFLHRDLKPDNFLVSKKGTTINLVDLGMCKRYWDPKKNKHVPYRETCSPAGTARYMSINTHLGREQSRRDDLEAIGYVLAYFECGRLPWQGIRAVTNEEKYKKIGRMKQETDVGELCLSPALRSYIQYSRNLGFEELPDYNHLRGLLLGALKDNGEEDDGKYCWLEDLE